MYSGSVDPLLAFVILATCGVVVVVISTRDQKRLRPWLIALVVYLALVISVAFFPAPVTLEAVTQGRWRESHGLGLNHNFRPFAILQLRWNMRELVRQILGNLLLFAPGGMLLKFRYPRLGICRGLAVILGFSLSIEILQVLTSLAYGFTFRTFDVDDVWLNFVGGLIGLLLGVEVLRSRTHLPRLVTLFLNQYPGTNSKIQGH